LCSAKRSTQLSLLESFSHNPHRVEPSPRRDQSIKNRLLADCKPPKKQDSKQSLGLKLISEIKGKLQQSRLNHFTSRSKEPTKEPRLAGFSSVDVDETSKKTPRLGRVSKRSQEKTSPISKCRLKSVSSSKKHSKSANRRRGQEPHSGIVIHNNRDTEINKKLFDMSKFSSHIGAEHNKENVRRMVNIDETNLSKYEKRSKEEAKTSKRELKSTPGTEMTSKYKRPKNEGKTKGLISVSSKAYLRQFI
jgi:hypothetical protein